MEVCSLFESADSVKAFVKFVMESNLLIFHKISVGVIVFIIELRLLRISFLEMNVEMIRAEDWCIIAGAIVVQLIFRLNESFFFCIKLILINFDLLKNLRTPFSFNGLLWLNHLYLKSWRPDSIFVIIYLFLTRHWGIILLNLWSDCFHDVKFMIINEKSFSF